MGKRPAELPLEPVIEAKKQCVAKEPPLEDDLSEISDDADEILNRDEVIKFILLLIFWFATMSLPTVEFVMKCSPLIKKMLIFAGNPRNASR